MSSSFLLFDLHDVKETAILLKNPSPNSLLPYFLKFFYRSPNSICFGSMERNVNYYIFQIHSWCAIQLGEWTILCCLLVIQFHSVAWSSTILLFAFFLRDKNLNLWVPWYLVLITWYFIDYDLWYLTSLYFHLDFIPGLPLIFCVLLLIQACDKALQLRWSKFERNATLLKRQLTWQ